MARDHRTAERRSLAYHRLVAERLDDAMVERARERLARFSGPGGPLHPVHAARWRALVDGPREELVRVFTADDEDARDLRQTSPFAVEIPPRERWRIMREVS